MILNRYQKNSGLNCKGNIIINTIFTVIIIFAFVMISYFGQHLFNELSDNVMTDMTHNESKEAFIEAETRYPATFSSLIMMVILGFWLFLIVTAMMSQDHPILFFVSSILMVFVIISSMLLSNFYEEFWDDSEFTGVTDNFSLPNYIMLHFMEFNIAIFFISLIITFAKSRG